MLDPPSGTHTITCADCPAEYTSTVFGDALAQVLDHHELAHGDLAQKLAAVTDTAVAWIHEGSQ